ncbi:MAG: oligosaccharide flippase family protein, partial [Pseudomonadota bacterium]
MTALAFSTLLRSARLPGDILAWARPGTLAASAMNASAWTLLGFGIQYPLRLAGNLAMAHLLAPDAFGLMALVLSLHLGLSLLSDVGIGQSIMRDPEGDTPRFLRTAWVVQILRGVALASCLLILATVLHFLGPGAAADGTVYADPVLPELIAASSAAVLIAGFQSTNLFLAVRRLQAKRHMLVELTAQVVALAVMVGLALAVASVWALLAGAVASAIAKTVLSHLVMKGPRMRWTWDPARASKLWRFGRWLIGASIGG